MCPDELNVTHIHTRMHAPMNGNQAVMQQYNDFKWFITRLHCAAALQHNQDNKSQQKQTNRAVAAIFPQGSNLLLLRQHL